MIWCLFANWLFEVAGTCFTVVLEFNCQLLYLYLMIRLLLCLFALA